MALRKFTADFWWVEAKCVLKDVDGYPEIFPKLVCGIGMETKQGAAYFFEQRLNLQNGKSYVLEKYDHDKLVVVYRRIKE